jgi:hypothetical protein
MRHLEVAKKVLRIDSVLPEHFGYYLDFPKVNNTFLVAKGHFRKHLKKTARRDRLLAKIRIQFPSAKGRVDRLL